VVLWEPFQDGIASDLGVHNVINKEVWDMINTPPTGMHIDMSAMWTQRADVIGYELVYKYGGLYVNTDIEPIRPLSELFQMYPEALQSDAAAMEDDRWLVNAVLWAPEPLSGFFKNAITMVKHRYMAMPAEYMNVTTGPHLLTLLASVYPIVAFDKEAFSHVHWSQVKEGSDASVDYSALPENVFGIHHWGHRKSGRSQTSWVS
jgi:hypothetical protein